MIIFFSDSHLFFFSEYHDYLRLANDWIRQHFIRVNIFIRDPHVTEIHYSASYRIGELLSDLGGCLGLWMGFSVLTIIEVLELIPALMHKLYLASTSQAVEQDSQTKP